MSHCLGQQQFQSLWDYILTNLVSQRRKKIFIPVYNCQVLGLLQGACMRVNYFKCYVGSLKGKEHSSEWLPGYHSITESNRPLLSPPLNHIPKCHIYTSFGYLQGWQLSRFPGQPFPGLDNPFCDFFLMSNLNLPWNNLQPLPLIRYVSGGSFSLIRLGLH